MFNFANLNKKINDEFGSLIAKNNACALVDFPDQPNVGDSAIWLGALKLLNANNLQIDYACTAETYSETTLRSKLPEGYIFIIGGGNFGTLWPRHQKLREKILALQGNYTVIQLPQSIYFDDESSVKNIRVLIENHKNFTLMVRDTVSQQFADNNFNCKVVLCPDLATLLSGDLPLGTATLDVQVLARDDIERSVEANKLNHLLKKYLISVDDWLHEPLTPTLLAAKLMQQSFQHGLDPVDVLGNGALSIWNAAARQRLARGCQLLSQGQVVVTDRLHAHIISSLMDIPNIILDNHYGKLSAYYFTWHRELKSTMLASSVEDVVDCVDKLMPVNELVAW